MNYSYYTHLMCVLTLFKKIGKVRPQVNVREVRHVLLVMLFSLSFLFPYGQLSAQSYCTPVGTPINGYCCNPNYMGIWSFVAGGISHTSGLPKSSGDCYTDFTNLVATASPGQNISLTMSTGPSYNQVAKIWVDWNGDGVFTDASPELVYHSDLSYPNGFTGSISGSFTVPANASPCAKRMRVVSDYRPSNGNPQPCDRTYYGTINDYTLNISGATGLDISAIDKLSPKQFSIGNNTLEFKFKNVGATTITSAEVGYQLSGYGKVTQNLSFNPTLGSCDAYDHSFSTPLNVPAAGTYTLKI
jgi:hypothetical protein